MKYLITLILSGISCLAPVAYGAESSCQALPDDEQVSGNMLLTLQSQVGGGELLQIDFEEAQYCVLAEASAISGERSAAAMRVNAVADELAVQVTIDDSRLWLRVDYSFSDALVLDRATSESLRLTDAEFLGDNSLLEASDFFVEFLDSMKIGDLVIEDVEVNVPRLDAPYEHYANRESSSQSEVVTVGSIGEVVLEELVLLIDFDKELIYAMEASQD